GFAARATAGAVLLPSGIRSIAGFLPLWLQVRKVSPVQLSSDHIDGPKRGNHVRDHVLGKNLRQCGHDRKARRAHPYAICVARAVAHNVETKLAVCAFHWKVCFALWSSYSMAVHDQFELLHEPFDVAVCVLFGRKKDPLFFCCDGLVLRTARSLE